VGAVEVDVRSYRQPAMSQRGFLSSTEGLVLTNPEATQNQRAAEFETQKKMTDNDKEMMARRRQAIEKPDAQESATKTKNKEDSNRMPL
jgi:hypothetical protein